MGCDIHVYSEKWNPFDKRWQSADIWIEDIRCSTPGELRVEPEVYEGRNYNLFAMLANVRNGYGFAGVDTGDGFVPIDMPRGLPPDVSVLVKKQSDGWGDDGHSHSYFTLRELKAYNWNGGITKLRGWVDARQYKVFKEKGKPESWSGGISGPDIVHLDNKAMEFEIITGGNSNVYTQVEWEETYADCADNFITETIPKLEAIVRHHNTHWGHQPITEDHVRIVFWFDS